MNIGIGASFCYCIRSSSELEELLLVELLLLELLRLDPLVEVDELDDIAA
jgi:hypothetical protein